MQPLSRDIRSLESQIAQLAQAQKEHQSQLQALELELAVLKTMVPTSKAETIPEEKIVISQKPQPVIPPVYTSTIKQAEAPKPPPSRPVPPFIPQARTPRTSIEFEKFIGENIISKIGILILVIGVGIGTKYAINKELLSPLTRIILGYLLGGGLLIFALRFKTKFENFSAILVSGAMAIMYLITFAAYNLYGLFSQGLAFGLMVLFTAFTVTAALQYNRQWIALLGLVGAYAVPFLLSNDSGNANVLFSYMALLNIGILAVAVKRYWQLLYYAAFGISWLIFASWYVASFSMIQHFKTGLIFATVFFLIFYAVFLINKLKEKQQFQSIDIVFVLFNSFIFYAIGFAILSDHPVGTKLTGLFTLGNAIIHFAVAAIIYRMKLADKNLFFLISGLVLVFITIAVPVQLDGNWVTLIWAALASLLFWIGRSKKIGFYEILSYPLMALTIISQMHDWEGMQLPYSGMYFEKAITPLFNIPFVVSLFVIAAFTWISMVGRQFPQERKTDNFNATKQYAYFFGSIFPQAAVLLLLYFTCRQELIHFWHGRYGIQHVSLPDEPFYTFSYHSPSLLVLKLWVLNYSMLFIAAVTYFNFKKIKSITLNYVLAISGSIALLAFIAGGLIYLGDLRDGFLIMPDMQEPQVPRGTVTILRYLTIACAAVLLYTLFHLKNALTPIFQKLPMIFDIVLHLTIVWVGSSELMTWLKLASFAQFDKLGLSIFWGVYALILIGLGIFTRKQHLRIGAIVLFGITLIKLFFYDIAHLNTMSKTIVLISLGILLLIISFLYNKFKGNITENNAV